MLVLLMLVMILVWLMLCYSIRCRWLVMFFLFSCICVSRVLGVSFGGIVIGSL